jgi:hypothetical protein
MLIQSIGNILSLNLTFYPLLNIIISDYKQMAKS